MNHSSGHISTIAVAVVTLAVGLVGGLGIAKAMQSESRDMKHGSSHASAASTGDKASDLRSSLVALGVEHMLLTNHAVDAALDGSPNAAEVGTALYANGTDIGAAVGSVYGKDAEKTFNTVWKIHLDEFVKYAVAGKSGDEAAKQAALANIDANYTKPLAQYLAKANPNLPADALESGLRDHVQMTARMIDAHVAGNYAEESKELKAANKHIEGIFSTLAGAIVKQYPDKF